MYIKVEDKNNFLNFLDDSIVDYEYLSPEVIEFLKRRYGIAKIERLESGLYNFYLPFMYSARILKEFVNDKIIDRRQYSEIGAMKEIKKYLSSSLHLEYFVYRPGVATLNKIIKFYARETSGKNDNNKSDDKEKHIKRILDEYFRKSYNKTIRYLLGKYSKAGKDYIIDKISDAYLYVIEMINYKHQYLYSAIDNDELLIERIKKVIISRIIKKIYEDIRKGIFSKTPIVIHLEDEDVIFDFSNIPAQETITPEQMIDIKMIYEDVDSAIKKVEEIEGEEIESEELIKSY